jgi:cyclase
MNLQEVRPGVIAFIRPDEGANVGCVLTSEGAIIIDTTSNPADIKTLLLAANVSPAEVSLVINTHFHSDHTWGNQVFQCPILAHHLCRERMIENLEGPWTDEVIESLLAAREQTDPSWAHRAREKLIGLDITPPTDTFFEQRVLEMGSTRLEVRHVDAHTADLSIVWLPIEQVLFASDLLFIERYPYLYDADIPALMTALKQLPRFEAEVFVPGHGPLCTLEDVAGLGNYLEVTWERVAHHIDLGHSEEQTLNDPDFPRYAQSQAERLHKANIRLMYKQCKGS